MSDTEARDRPEYMALEDQGGETTTIVHRPTGRTISRLSGPRHAQKAQRVVDDLNENGEEE